MENPVVNRRNSVLDRLVGDLFKVEEDLGVVVWDPEGASQGATDEPPRSGSCEMTATRIKACIADPESKAEVLRDVQEMQNEVNNPTNPHEVVRFARQQLPKDERPSGFPHTCPRVVALYEAEKRGVDLEKIDFLLGGSFLNACVRPDCFLKGGDNHEDQPADYLVENCKGVLVVNKEDFSGENRTFPTYQFKRWACGRAMEAKHPKPFMEHLRVAKIGNFRVLFAASVDALQAGSQQPVKIRMREVKDDTLVELVLQLLSCGAGSLINGTRRKTNWLVRVDELDLERDLMPKIQQSKKLREELTLGMTRVVSVLTQLKSQELREGETYVLGRHSPDVLMLDLQPSLTCERLLPPPEVIEDLFLYQDMSAASAKLGMFRRLMPLNTFAHINSFLERLRFMGVNVRNAETGPVVGKNAGGRGKFIPDDDGDAVTAFMEDVMTCYLSCRSAVTHETASSLAINESSRTEKEVLRELLKCIPPLFENAQRRTWVHYWLVRQYDAFYENWQEKLPAELLPLMQERTGESPHAETKYKYRGDFLGLLRFARNQITHLGTSERPSENEESALQYLAERVAGRRTKDQKLRTKGFAASLMKVLRERFPAFHVHAEAIRTKAAVWTHAGADAVALLGIQDEDDNGGHGALRRAVDKCDAPAVAIFLKKARRKAIAQKINVREYVFWRGSDGRHALDAIEKQFEIESVHAVDPSNGERTGHWISPQLRSIYGMLVETLPAEPMPRPAGLLHRLASVPSPVVRARVELLLEWGMQDRWPDEKTGLTAGETAYVRIVNMKMKQAHGLEEAARPSLSGIEDEHEEDEQYEQQQPNTSQVRRDEWAKMWVLLGEKVPENVGAVGASGGFRNLSSLGYKFLQDAREDRATARGDDSFEDAESRRSSLLSETSTTADASDVFAESEDTSLEPLPERCDSVEEDDARAMRSPFQTKSGQPLLL